MLLALNPLYGVRLLASNGYGGFLVLEDNARTPSGVSYVVENRHVMLRTFPDLMAGMRLRPVDDYGRGMEGNTAVEGDVPPGYKRFEFRTGRGFEKLRVTIDHKGTLVKDFLTYTANGAQRVAVAAGFTMLAWPTKIVKAKVVILGLDNASQ